MRSLRIWATIIVVFSSFIAVTPAQDEKQRSSGTETFVSYRTGFMSGEGKTSYRYMKFFQLRKNWILPGVGYVDSGQSSFYREMFVGGGSVLLNNKHITVIEEGYYTHVFGTYSAKAKYIQPWTTIIYQITPKLGGTAIYFASIPLNKMSYTQHFLEHAKLEYDFDYFKIGGGYSAYKFDKFNWQNRPFATFTLKAGKLGNIEVWVQKMGLATQVQIRYQMSFRSRLKMGS